MISPKSIQLIGNEVAILWADEKESYYAAPILRAASPSASAQGEKDIFGQQYGGEFGQDHSGVAIAGWQMIGNYAVRFEFSDGHKTGLYSYDYLRELDERMKGNESD
jgi:DUF971 family protein